MNEGRPVVAVVGRPNVGKSTLVNRIIGRREAVVEDVPGVTRDRVAYDALWAGCSFTIVDTGGWETRSSGLAGRVTEQAKLAVATADAVMFVVDATVGATTGDEEVARVLRRANRPIVLVANKVDDARSESDATELWSLGLGQPWPVSALHGRGSGELLEALVGVLPENHEEEGQREDGPRRVALLGRPNVGKSSLLNRLAGEERALVDKDAGTTRDPVDTLAELGDEVWRFVDTAGVRRRAHEAQGAEYYATLRTTGSLAKAEASVVLVDASQSLSEQDVRVVNMVVDAGRALVLAFNKWDLVDDDRRISLEREVERDLAHVRWAPRVNVSARTGWHVDRLATALRTSLTSWDQRVPTAALNAWLTALVAATPPPVRRGRQPKILFATQAANRPPRLVLFTTGALEASYLRFIERRLREEFGFTGSPVDIAVRLRRGR